MGVRGASLGRLRQRGVDRYRFNPRAFDMGAAEVLSAGGGAQCNSQASDMRGGSGVSPEDYRIGIANGLRKINYYSYMSKAGVNAVKEQLAKEDVTFYHDLALTAQKAMETDAERAMRVFAGM